MKNFTDFMIDITKDAELGKECVNKLHEGDHIELSAWLKGKGYAVDENECKKLHDNKDDIKKSSAVGVY
jgi:hypothetical protein